MDFLLHGLIVQNSLRPKLSDASGPQLLLRFIDVYVVNVIVNTVDVDAHNTCLVVQLDVVYLVLRVDCEVVSLRKQRKQIYG